MEEAGKRVVGETDTGLDRVKCSVENGVWEMELSVGVDCGVERVEGDEEVGKDDTKGEDLEEDTGEEREEVDLSEVDKKEVAEVQGHSVEDCGIFVEGTEVLKGLCGECREVIEEEN